MHNSPALGSLDVMKKDVFDFACLAGSLLIGTTSVESLQDWNKVVFSEDQVCGVYLYS
jgi:hypothetical protein